MTNEKVIINKKSYTLYIQYQNEEKYRKEFNRLTQLFWKFDFENYYQSGYWDDTCILFSLFDSDKMVSHATVSLFQTIIAGETKKLLQLGTVMTDASYQQQGLSRFLMERILSDFSDKADGIFLFANDSVLDFYPKFGFSPVTEYQAYSEFRAERSGKISKQKLDLDNQEHLQLMEDLVQHTVPFSAFPMNNFGLTFFYCYAYPDFGFKDAIYYIDSLQTIVVAQVEGQVLNIFGVFSKNEVPLDEVFKAFSEEDITAVEFGFTPKGKHFQFKEYKEEDLTLFVSEGLLSLFRKNRWMIPMLSHT